MGEQKREEQMQPLVFEHVSSNDHNGFLEDCSISLIEKTDGSDPTRKKGTLEKNFEDFYSIWVEHDRLIILFGQIFKLLRGFRYFSSEGCLHRLVHILLVVFVACIFKFRIS